MASQEAHPSDEKIDEIYAALRKYSISEHSQTPVSETTVDLIRMLRNSCIHDKQRTALLKTSIPDLLVLVIQNKISDLKNHRKSVVCSCQFLGNFVVANSITQSHVWSLIYPSLIRSLLHIEDKQLVTIATMIIYNCLKSPDANVENLFKDPSSSDNLALTVCSLLTAVSDQDWIILTIVEHFLPFESFLPMVFTNGSQDCRINVLDVMLHSPDQVFKWSEMPDHTFRFLQLQFEKDCNAIDNLDESKNLDVLSTLKLLETLCVITGEETTCREKLTKGNLIDIAVDVLRRVHRAGKENCASVFGLSQVKSPGAGANESSPVAGFKSDLIRLIGNLAYRNPTNQNKARQLGGIELILDHFQLDDVNPCILSRVLECSAKLTPLE